MDLYLNAREDTRLHACVRESFDLLIEPFASSFCPSKSFPVSGHPRHFLGLMRRQFSSMGWKLNKEICYRMQEYCHIVAQIVIKKRRIWLSWTWLWRLGSFRHKNRNMWLTLKVKKWSIDMLGNLLVKAEYHVIHNTVCKRRTFKKGSIFEYSFLDLSFFQNY